MLDKAIKYISKRLNDQQIELGMILGSGLGVLAENMQDPLIISYNDIPGFPISRVEGHAGQLVLGKIAGKTCMILQGRVHYYEGHSMSKVCYPVEVMAGLGIKKLIVTCASGGVNKKLNAGDIMLIDDQINFTFNNPLIKQNRTSEQRFVDSSQVYCKRLKIIAREVAQKNNITLNSGVYFCMTGPSYETPVEIRMIRYLGGDMAGMSTFHESLLAYGLGMEVLGISYISNMGAGIQDGPLYHEEVIETIKVIKMDLHKLIFEIIKQM